MAAVVLLSGGLDSAVTVAKALNDGHDVTALSFIYGQRHSRELDSAKRICEHYGVRNVMVDIDLSMFRSSLIDKDSNVQDRNADEIGKDIPDTYVPARNIIMLSVAAGLCESVDADVIYIGANTVDYSGYPDCREEFFIKFQEMIAVGTKAGVEGRPIRIEAPILHMSKKEIVLLGKQLNVPFELTWSCYNGRERACGKCDSCVLRRKGFSDAGYDDPIEYE